MLGGFNFRNFLSQTCCIVGGAGAVAADGGIVANNSTLYRDLACSIQPIAGDEQPEFARSADQISDHVLITDIPLKVPVGAMVTSGGLTYRVTFASAAGGAGNVVGIVTQLFLRLIQI